MLCSICRFSVLEGSAPPSTKGQFRAEGGNLQDATNRQKAWGSRVLIELNGEQAKPVGLVCYESPHPIKTEYRLAGNLEGFPLKVAPS